MEGFLKSCGKVIDNIFLWWFHCITSMRKKNRKNIFMVLRQDQCDTPTRVIT